LNNLSPPGHEASDDLAPGIYDGIPHEEYLGMRGLSVSRLKIAAKAPAKAQFGEMKETDATRLGTLWHCAVLESDQFEKRYAPTRLDRKGTKAWAEEEARAMGRELVKIADYDEARRVRDAVHRHRAAHILLSGDLAVEQSIFWVDPITGLRCRGRADGIHQQLRAVIDAKTTVDASEEMFTKAIAKFKYHWQQAFYEDGIYQAQGWMPEAFVFIAIEKEMPYLTGCYEIEPPDILRARADVRHQIDKYAECKALNHWPGYSEEIRSVSLPRWAFMEDDDE
jgi:exodeoxyribonuclease VIII